MRPPVPDPITLTTPAPVYPDPPPVAGPPLRAMSERARVGAAVSAVKRMYSGAVAETLIDALTWHQSTTYRVNPSSLPARLVDELLRPPS